MALVFNDRVLETSTTTGTGAFTLAAAVTGYQRFADACSTNDTCYYAIFAVDGNGNPSGDWETGLGTYSGANTLTRTTVQQSSNSDNAVNFGAGTKYVMLAPTAAFIATLYRSGGTDVALADGGTGASLADPGADRIMFWDDSNTTVDWLTVSTGLTISGTTISATGGGAGGSLAYEAVPTTVPDLSAFTTWRNQGTAAVAADSYGVVFTNDIDGELHIREQNLPATPFSYYARIRLETYDTGAATSSVFILGGFAIINSTSGRVLFCYLMSQRISGDENNVYFAAIDTYSSVTVGVATVAGPAYGLEPFHWIRVDVTATDVTLFGSVDGRRWTQVGSAVAFATYLNAAGGTADKFGICVRSSGAGTHKMLFDVLQSTAP